MLSRLRTVEFQHTVLAWAFGLVVAPMWLAARTSPRHVQTHAARCWSSCYPVAAFAVFRWAVAYLFGLYFASLGAVFRFVPDRLFTVSCVMPAALAVLEVLRG